MKNFVIVSIVMMFFLILPTVNAGGLGMAPVKTEINNALRGFEYKNMVTIFSSFEDDISLSLDVAGDCSGWVSLYPYENPSEAITTLSMAPMSETKLLAKFKIPEDAPAGNYTCTIYTQQNVEETENVQIIAIRVKSDVRIMVTGEELPKGDIRGITINNPVVNSPLKIEIIFENTGNVTATPIIKANISKGGISIDKIDYRLISVAPGKAETIKIEKDTIGWETGDYEMPMEVYLIGLIYERPDIAFSITEAGEEPSQTVIIGPNNNVETNETDGTGETGETDESGETDGTEETGETGKTGETSDGAGIGITGMVTDMGSVIIFIVAAVVAVATYLVYKKKPKPSAHYSYTR